MQRHRSETGETAETAAAPWHVPLALEEVPEMGRRLLLVADASVRAEVARMAGLREVPRLEADFEVTRYGAEGLHVVGKISATVGQNCVVTLEPLANEVEENIDLIFVPKSPVERAAEDSDGPDTERDYSWGAPEPLIGGCLDLGALATEFLILGIDPYPRKRGAIFEPPRPPEPADSPFAALAGLQKGRDDT